MKTLIALACLFTVALAQLPTFPEDFPTAFPRPTGDCTFTREETEALATCTCVPVRRDDGCPMCPTDCTTRCPDISRLCDLACPNGFQFDDSNCRLCMCRQRDNDDDDDDIDITIDEIRDRFLCHPDCIAFNYSMGRFMCDRECNSTLVHMDNYNECDDTTPCEDGGRCAIFGTGNINVCINLPDMGEECSNYDPTDDEGEDDIYDEFIDGLQETFSDEDFNDGSDDRFFASYLMESVDRCGTGLTCDSDSRTCGELTGPCVDAVRAGDVSMEACDLDGFFDVRRCAPRQGDGTPYGCSCVRPDTGRQVFGTERGVVDPREFDRRDCIRQIFRNCSVALDRDRSSQVYHGDVFVMATESACRACRCNNGTGVDCREVDSDRCPRPSLGRSCTLRNGDTVEDGERQMIGDCNLCRCVDGDFQCTRAPGCGGDDEEDDQERMCQACSSMPRSVVCAPDGRTFPNMCAAMRCGGFSSDEDEIIRGPCANSPVCTLLNRCTNAACVRTGGVACRGRCDPGELRMCVNRTLLRCPANSTVDDREAVCGTDGQSYRSLCHMIKLGRPNTQVAHFGRCDKSECTGGMVCGSDGVTYGSVCEIRTLTANARVDHMGECERDDDGAMTEEQLCERTRDNDRCSTMACSMRVMPRQGCCAVCGGITTVALDGDNMERRKRATGEPFDLDDIMNRLQEYNIIPIEDFQKCSVKGTLPLTTSKPNLEVTFEALREDAAEYCNMASQRLAETLNEDATSIPDIATFASASVAAPLVVGGAPGLTGSVLAVMMAAIFAAVSLLF